MDPNKDAETLEQEGAEQEPTQSDVTDTAEDVEEGGADDGELFTLDDDSDDDEEPEADEDGVQDEGDENSGEDEGEAEAVEGQEGEAGEVLTDDQAQPPEPAAPLEGRELVKAITSQARVNVEAMFGSAFDEFNPEHIVALGIESQKITRNHQNHQTAIVEAKAIFEKNGGEKFLANWTAYMDDMRAADHKAMLDAEKRGDYSLTLKNMQACAARVKGSNVNAKAKAQGLASTTNRPKPPVTMPAGNGSSPAKKRDKNVFGLDDLGL